MKILYFTDRNLLRGNAEAVHVLEVVRSLASAGHDVTLMAPVPLEPMAGVQTINYGREQAFKHVLAVWFQQLFVAPILAARQMRGGSFDGMYVRLTIPLLLSTWLLRWACGERPLILEVNGILRSELSRRRRLMYAPIVPIEGVLLRRAAAIVAASEEIQRDLVRRHHPIYVVAIPNGVDPKRFRPIAQQDARRAVNLDPVRPIVGFVGNFAPWHGIEVLLRSVPAILERHPTAQIVLVGGGSHRPVVETLIAELGLTDAIHLVGPVPHESVTSYINAFDCCVSPAVPMANADPGRNSLKVFEYLACGVPVVVSDLPGIATLVGEHQLGATVPPGDEVALAQAISDVLLLNEDERARIRETARSLVINEYSWDANVARVVKLFEEHLPGPIDHFAPAGMVPVDIDTKWSAN